MYELPDSLQQSLCSYRGSNRLSRDEEVTSHFDASHDLEKQIHVHADETSSSPTHSVHSGHIDEHGRVLRPAVSLSNIRDAAQSQQHQHPRISVRTSATDDRQPTAQPQQQQQQQQPAAHEIQATAGANADIIRSPLNDDPAADRLMLDTTPLKPNEFYELVGMLPPDPKTGLIPKDWDTVHGFYRQVRYRERSVGQRYRFYDIVVSALLVLQLLLSAVFIVLGSINAIHHITITVLGAVSTLTAGILALVKGQGLPTRLRMERDGLRAVLYQTQLLYSDMRANRPLTFKDVEMVRQAYSKVMVDAARNHPDTWTSSDDPTTTTKSVQGLPNVVNAFAAKKP